MSMSSSQPQVSATRTAECRFCGLFFSPGGGLARHITVTHSAASQPVTNNASSSLSSGDSLSVLLNQVQVARQRVSVVRIIPVQCRLAVSMSYNEVLRNVITNKTTASWSRLLSFALCVLHLPRVANNKKQKLGAVISRNLRDFKNGMSLSDVIASNPVPHQRSPSSKTNKIRLTTQKLNEGDIRAAVRMLASDDTVALGPEVLNALRERHPPAPSDEEMPLPLLYRTILQTSQ